MEVLSPLRLGPERVPGSDHARLSLTEPWFSPLFQTTSNFGPRAPPSPPEEMSSNRPSLPSIADILNSEGEDDRPKGKRRASSHDEDERSRKQPRIDSSANKASAASGQFPPTPPLGYDAGRKNEAQPLPTLQPRHVSRIPSTSFSPESRYRIPAYPTAQEPKSAVLNTTNVPPVLSPTAMSAPPVDNATVFSQGRKRRSDAEHTRRSRSPPGFYSRPSRHSDASAPLSASSTSAHRTHRSGSSDFYLQSPMVQQVNRPYGSEYQQQTSPATSVTASLPSNRGLPLDYQAHAQQQPRGQSAYQQPYSPQSSPTSTHASAYDARVRSASWGHPNPHPASATAQAAAHHHPTTPSTSVVAAANAAAADRYICPTCGKCFSRPSSLRIHSHSHTGEKPFRCSREGCGKAFSVRSNMKRHEKGCHASGVLVGGGPHGSSFSDRGPHGGGFSGSGPPPGGSHGAHGPPGSGPHGGGPSSASGPPGPQYSPASGGGHPPYSAAPHQQHHVLPSTASGHGVPVLPVPTPPSVGLGLRGLPSIASTLHRPRELAPALDAL